MSFFSTLFPPTHRNVTKLLQLSFICLICLAVCNPAAAAPADKEKGPNCSDGIDNDGDDLVDDDDPDCGGKDDGTSSDGPIQFRVEIQTTGGSNPWSPNPVTCAAYTSPDSTGFRVYFPRHMTCAPECGVALDKNNSLTDDIQLNLRTRKGKFIGFTLTGQDIIGEDGIMHKSDEIALNIPIPDDLGAGFTVSIEKDVYIDRLKGHLGGPSVGLAGVIQVGKLIYTPCVQDLDCPTTWPVEIPDACQP